MIRKIDSRFRLLCDECEFEVKEDFGEFHQAVSFAHEPPWVVVKDGPDMSRHICPWCYYGEEWQTNIEVTVAKKPESRDQRRQVVMTKTLAAKVKAKQKKTGLSFNEAVNQLLQMWVDGK